MQIGQKYPAVAILCAQAAYIRSIELRRLKWTNVVMPGDLLLVHEPLGTAALVVLGPKKGQKPDTARVFNDEYIFAMLQILHVEEKTMILQKNTDPRQRLSSSSSFALARCISHTMMPLKLWRNISG